MNRMEFHGGSGAACFENTQDVAGVGETGRHHGETG